MSVHHEILGITPGASRKQIDQAYRRMSKKYHPDRPGGNEPMMKKVNEAYEALTTSPNLNSTQFKNHTKVKFDFRHTPDEDPWSEWKASQKLNEADAPDDNLGGYSYNQHMEELYSEAAGDKESERIAKQTKEAKAQGWTPERVEHMDCAWCNGTMEGTEPHEILNKVEPQTASEKLFWERKLVGMHDECYEDAKRTVNFNSYCEMCDQPLNRHNNKICFETMKREMDL